MFYLGRFIDPSEGVAPSKWWYQSAFIRTTILDNSTYKQVQVAQALALYKQLSLKCCNSNLETYLQNEKK